jgi:hypothetical protein
MNLNDLGRQGATFCASKAGLAIGDGAKTGTNSFAAANGAGIDFCIDGIGYHKADAATVAPFTAAAVQPVLTKCLYLVQIDSAGTITTVKGTAVLTADLTAGNKVLQWPQPAAGKCPVGAVKITLASTATFTAGTTALDATNVTATYYDFVGGMPSAPLTS